MATRAESIAEYILWLMKKYQEIKQIHNESAYRVINIKETKKETILTIQISGKSTIFTATSQEIVANDTFLECFSKKDIRLISKLAFNNKKPKAKVVLQEFCEKMNKVVFGIKSPGTDDILKKSAGEISLDKNLLNELTAEEVLMIGYLLADEGFSAEKEALMKNEA